MRGEPSGGGHPIERAKLLLATGSRHKLAELRELLRLDRAVLVSLEDVGIVDEAPEEADTFRENALSKARFYSQQSGMPTLADDSGLEVDALGGGPGVRTRRYAGEMATDEENNAKLLRELAGVAQERRTARYVCVLAFLQEPGAEPLFAQGVFEGRVAFAPRGAGGFGYDPIFEPATEVPGSRTVGQLSAAEKNAVSHRALAAGVMREHLVALGY